MTFDRTAPADAGSSPVVLQVDGLDFAYPQRPLFSGFSARIPPGVTLVRGGDGVGKTTLLRLLAGALPAQTGRLLIQGVDLAGPSAGARKQVFWADPRADTHEQDTPVEWFESLRSPYPGFDTQVLNDLVDGFGLAPHVHKPLYMLSAGSKRKVRLTAAFASGAAVTLLDEPFAALDKASAGFVLELLHEAARDPSRAWIVAHYEAPGDVPLASIIDLGD